MGPAGCMEPLLPLLALFPSAPCGALYQGYKKCLPALGKGAARSCNTFGLLFWPGPFLTASVKILVFLACW